MGKEEKKLLIACLVLVVILGGGGLLKKNALQKEQQESQATILVDQEDFDKMTVRNQQGEQVLIKKKGSNDPLEATYRDNEFSIEHQWYVQNKVIHYASQATVDTMIDSINELALQTTILPTPERLAEYQLDQPLFEVVLEKDAKKQTLLFGGMASSQEGRYVYHKEKNLIGLVGLNLDFLQDRSIEQWFEMSVIQIRKSDIAAVQRGVQQLLQEDNRWQLQFGKQVVPANDEEVKQWIRSVNALRSKSIKVEKVPGEIKQSMSIIYAGENAKALDLQLLKNKDEYWVTRSDDHFAYQVAEKDAEKIFISFDPLIDLNLLQDPEQITDLTVDDGSTQLALHKEKQWMIEQ
ncbi:MAG: DUF4340 domain-containing protein, partial [Deltaproteobacteria bacterium]|nr:DUF4340 domain-containing protein [Deltaproteobacteria bacterium]